MNADVSFGVELENVHHAVGPLGLTCEQFAANARASHGLSHPDATDAYKRLFRAGAVDQPKLKVALPPIARMLEEQSPEGPVYKFVQRIPALPREPRALARGGSLRMAIEAGAGAGAETGADPPQPLPPGGVPEDGRAALRLAQFSTLDIESVLIPMVGRKGLLNYTLCVSSQVGCAMNCGFCETAQMGLIRSLTPAEIVGQWFAATHVLKQRPTNMVFMGMGEPLDNYENLIQAIAVLIDHNGAAMPVSKITVSTVGRLDGLAKLREQIHQPGWHRLNLAVSLNAPNDEIRSRIMPVNRSMPMAALREMLAHWPIYGGGKLCLEYVLIPGVNDAREHAAELREFVEPINRRYAEETDARTPRVCLNLIPYNPRRESPWPAPSEERVDEFMGWLNDAGIYVKRRRTKGRNMMGACGQLGSERIRQRKLVQTGAEESHGT